MAALEDEFARSAAGEFRVLLLSGEAGVGKSRLGRELLATSAAAIKATVWVCEIAMGERTPAIAPEIADAARQVDPGRAADIIWTLTGYDVYRALVTQRHWPAGRYQNWLAATLAASVLREPET
jgi:hypothetical protein